MIRVLYLLHSYYNLAGTEEHTRMLAEGLGEEFEAFILAPHRDRVVLIKDGVEVVWFPVPPIPWPVAPRTSPAHTDVIKNVIAQVSPHLIHIQHVMHWPLSVLDQITDTGIPTAISFHDYFPITPHFTMQGVEDPRVTLGPNYATHFFGSDISPYLRERREVLNRSLNVIPVKITPSRFLADLFATIFPGNYTVIPHGIRPFTPVPRIPASPPVFGCVGSLLPQKGYLSLLEGFRLFHEHHPSSELHLFGGGDGAVVTPQEGVTFHGNYQPGDIPTILSLFDVGIIPSIFAETFCLVLSELWHAGRAVGASRIGALKERITDGVNGRLFTPGNPGEIAQTLEWFTTNESWRKWEVPEVRLLDAMIGEYQTLYRSMVK